MPGLRSRKGWATARRAGEGSRARRRCKGGPGRHSLPSADSSATPATSIPHDISTTPTHALFEGRHHAEQRVISMTIRVTSLYLPKPSVPHHPNFNRDWTTKSPGENATPQLQKEKLPRMVSTDRHWLHAYLPKGCVAQVLYYYLLLSAPQ